MFLFRQNKKTVIQSVIPGMPAIDLFEFYKEFEWYYPNCELNTKKWFVKNAKPDWTYIDAGANVGIYTILFSKLSPYGYVYAFEPTKTSEMLLKNLEINNVKNAKVFTQALGKTVCVKKENIYRIWGKAAETLKYEFTTIDNFLEQNRINKIDAIKIDVDSFDFEVLQGAEKTLKSLNPWLVVELNHALSKRGQSNSEAFLWLQSQGYNQALVIDHENFVLKKEEENKGPCFKLFYQED